MCTEKVPDPIGPCKPLCLRIQTDCAPLLNEFKYSWPSALDCNRFPESNDGKHMCMPGLARTSSEEEEIEEPEEKTLIDNNDQFSKEVEHQSNVVGESCSVKERIYVKKIGDCLPLCSTTLDLTVVS